MGSPCLHLSGYDLFADNESSLKHFGAAGPKPKAFELAVIICGRMRLLSSNQ